MELGPALTLSLPFSCPQWGTVDGAGMTVLALCAHMCMDSWPSVFADSVFLHLINRAQKRSICGKILSVLISVPFSCYCFLNNIR